jgi:hypothetical protein
MPPIRVYPDTSVYGGVFDSEFQSASRAFFNEVRDGRFLLVTSAVAQYEVSRAPDQVQRLFDSLMDITEVADVSDETVSLQNAYIRAGILTSGQSEDALHVAIASTARCTLVVSWNFRHIIHFQKIPLFNAVNILEGYD